MKYRILYNLIEDSTLVKINLFKDLNKINRKEKYIIKDKIVGEYITSSELIEIEKELNNRLNVYSNEYQVELLKYYDYSLNNIIYIIKKFTLKKEY